MCPNTTTNSVEEVHHKSVCFTVWDVGGCDKIRPLYRHYFQNTDALIFVIDSSDRDRFAEALDELVSICTQIRTEQEQSGGSIFAGILILANKQDISTAMTPREITLPLLANLEPLNIKWTLVPCSAIANNKLNDGFEWLSELSKGKPKSEPFCSLFLGSFSEKLQNGQSSSAKTQAVISGVVPSTEYLLTKIRAGNDFPGDPEKFLLGFSIGEVAPFDHRAHLRIGYLILLDCAKKGFTNTEAVEIFMSRLKQFFKLAGSRVRNTFHM
ncbi:hypothetical protein HK100_007391 [Physocladia obscura]|uniref:Uncharacterized protein n=1 Tax=Physocladia obscura TaxID=109957 RepID=A0AAD5T6H2_9FUNG|nr:hypothetical protein HK100_007391 [Physocladia obscura]